jgi:hypothetical protein
MTQSPKTRFLENKHEVDSLLELTSRAQFLKACDFAMLQVIAETPSVNDPVEAAAAWHRLEGARSFLRHLLTLAEQHKPITQYSSGNLNHKA